MLTVRMVWVVWVANHSDGVSTLMVNRTNESSMIPVSETDGRKCFLGVEMEKSNRITISSTFQPESNSTPNLGQLSIPKSAPKSAPNRSKSLPNPYQISSPNPSQKIRPQIRSQIRSQIRPQIRPKSLPNPSQIFFVIIFSKESSSGTKWVWEQFGSDLGTVPGTDLGTTDLRTDLGTKFGDEMRPPILCPSWFPKFPPKIPKTIFK